MRSRRGSHHLSLSSPEHGTISLLPLLGINLPYVGRRQYHRPYPDQASAWPRVEPTHKHSEGVIAKSNSHKESKGPSNTPQHCECPPNSFIACLSSSRSSTWNRHCTTASYGLRLGSRCVCGGMRLLFHALTATHRTRVSTSRQPLHNVSKIIMLGIRRISHLINAFAVVHMLTRELANLLRCLVVTQAH